MVSRQRLRLLVACEFPANATGGGPAVVRQMLDGWPAEDLFWWSCFPERDARFGQAVGGKACARIPAKLRPHYRATRLKSWLLERAWAPFAAAHLRRTIHAVRPEAIWAIPHNWAILPQTAVLPTAEVGFHVTFQDYVDVHRQVETFGPARCQRMAGLADALYAGATTRDATSHPMVADLRARTGASAAQMLHAGVEDREIRMIAERPARPQAGEVRIAHAGTVLVPKAFALFVEAVDRLRPDMPQPVTLELFGANSHASERWFDPAWMRERGILAEPELRAALSECTWGFSPMVLTDAAPRYNRFSFPTKFITYLSAGLPVITLGHPECSVMKMAAQYAVGPSSSATDAATLAEQLRGALSDPNPSSRYGAEVLRCAKEEFSASRMRAGLHECLAKCAEATRARRES